MSGEWIEPECDDQPCGAECGERGKAMVKSKVLKSKPGNLKGVRLIQVDSLLQFLQPEDEGGAA